MSRWKSPQTAAKHAERDAKAAAQRRKEKRNDWLTVFIFAVALIGPVVADYFWLRARAQKHREQHMQTRQQSVQTNDVVHGSNNGRTNYSSEP